jgi:hypothetical protein
MNKDEKQEPKAKAPDFVLADGTEVRFDLKKMTYKQFKGLFDSREADETSDETLMRVASLDQAQLDDLDYVAYKRLFGAFLKKCREPLSDPN